VLSIIILKLPIGNLVHPSHTTTTKMPNQTRDYGDLKVTLTKDWDWMWDDSRSGASKNISVFHAKSQGDMRPLGSFAHAAYNTPDKIRATILVGNASNNPLRPAVASPLGYTKLWDDENSKGKHNGSWWRPVSFPGYVSLGDVCVNRWTVPSINMVWCVRSDLVSQTDFNTTNVWDDRGSGSKKDCSVWSVKGPNPNNTSGSDKIPIVSDLVRANGGYDMPPIECAKLLALPYPRDFTRFSADMPKFTQKTRPTEGDVFETMSQCEVTLPFIAFFPPTDRLCLSQISKPFVKLQKFMSWHVEDVIENDDPCPGTFESKITKGVSDEQSKSMSESVGVQVTASFGIKAIGGGVDVSLNYQFTAENSSSHTEYIISEKVHKFTIGGYAASVVLTSQVVLKATRNDGSQTIHNLHYNASDDLSRTGYELAKP
jgi:hypothetical protein